MSLPARKLSSLRDLLRTSTADQHAALEATPVMRAFADGATDARVARAYLTRQERLHRALERTLAPHLTPRESQLRLQRSTWLADDLHALGIAPDAREPSVPAVTDRAGALGVLYVLEGSTLGLRMVRNRLRHAGSAGWPMQSRFVLGYGDASGRHWQSFLAELESLPESEWPAAVAAAQATFRAFLAAFAESDHD